MICFVPTHRCLRPNGFGWSLLSISTSREIPTHISYRSICRQPVNMAILATLSAARIMTTHGGLVRLLAVGVIRVAHSPGINPTYPTEAQLLFAAGWFQYRYGPVDGRSLCIFSGTPARSFAAASRCALWLLNALIVLPALGRVLRGSTIYPLQE